nr:glycosyl hydrolase family 28-related protein [Sphingomonas sp. JXJ CY 53]
MLSVGGTIPLVPLAIAGQRDPVAAGIAPGTMVARPGGRARTLQAKALDIYSVNDKGALGDGRTDDTAAINAAILEVHRAGGGEVIFGTSPSPYHVVGPILLPSNVAINLNGQTLVGRSFNEGVMFATATVRNDILVRNNQSFQQNDAVLYSSVRNGVIKRCAIAFEFRNFNVSCHITDVATLDVLQFGVFFQCFYMSLTNCSARGPSDRSKAAFAFTGHNNLITLLRVSATMESGFLFEGGTASVSLIGCSCEGGGGSAVAFRGDCLGIFIDSGYWEAIPGTVFDFRAAGVCSVSFRGNYVNYADTILDDGGPQSPATLFGSFDASNYLANIGITHDDRTYRGRMLLSCPRNFIRYEIPFANDAPTGAPANWTIGPSIQAARDTAFTGRSLSDVRSRSRLHYGAPIPLSREGDVGDPYPGTIDRSGITIATGGGAVATVDSAISWRPNSLRATFILAVMDNAGAHKLFGDIYGDQLVRQDRSDKRVLLEQYQGRVRLRVGDIDNRSGGASITGSLQICT